MRRWFLLPPLFLVGLFLALHATAAVKDADAMVTLISLDGGQYRLALQNTGSAQITSFVFTAGPALKMTSIVSASTGSCQLSGSTSFTCSVALDPPPCACRPGGTVEVVFAGTGDWGGSKVSVNSSTITLGTAPAVTTQTTTQTQTTTTTQEPKKKPVPKCKKGQKSTKKKPCHK